MEDLILGGNAVDQIFTNPSSLLVHLTLKLITILILLHVLKLILIFILILILNLPILCARTD